MMKFSQRWYHTSAIDHMFKWKWWYNLSKKYEYLLLLLLFLLLFMLSLFRVAPFSETTAFQGGPDTQYATT